MSHPHVLVPVGPEATVDGSRSGEDSGGQAPHEESTAAVGDQAEVMRPRVDATEHIGGSDTAHERVDHCAGQRATNAHTARPQLIQVRT